MKSRISALSIVLCMVLSMLIPMRANGAAPECQWQAYWLTGGSNAENGHPWLLITRLKLETLAAREELATPITPKASIQILDSVAVWIATYGKNSILNTDGQPLKIPPLIRNYRLDDQKVLVGDVEYQVEPVPIAVAVDLLRKPYGRGGIHRMWPPLAGMEHTAQAFLAMLEAKANWQAFVLTGGPNAERGYRRLLVSQLNLQELATLGTPNASQQDAPAIWIETYDRGANWAAVEAFEIAPPITNLQLDQQLVTVDGVEYHVESAPFGETISLLRKALDEEHVRKASGGPLYLRNRTALALKEHVKSELMEMEAPTQLNIGGSFGGERSVIESKIAQPDPRSGTPHGLQVTLGPEKRLRELAIYDNGFLERRTNYIEDGFELVHEQFKRESFPGGHGGNGYRRVDRRGVPGEPSTTLAQGYLFDGRPWHGSFVFVEAASGDDAFNPSARLVWREYSEGKITTSKTDITLGFGDREKDQVWLDTLPAAFKDR
jgi:hypothetical protein